MFSTAKEVHVYIDGATQLLSSNRKQSIRPEQTDMILNNAVLEYISSRFPERSNGKDIEATLKRYTDFSVLKSELVQIPIIKLDSGYSIASVDKPFNAIKVQDVLCSYLRPFVEFGNVVEDRKCVGIISINDGVINTPDLSFKIVSITNDVRTEINISFTDILVSVKSTQGAFYLYDSILDRLRNIHRLNVSYSSTDVKGNREYKIHCPLGTSIVELSSNSQYVSTSIKTTVVKTSADKPSRKAPCSIMSGFEARLSLSDYYGRKNLYLSPIVEMVEDSVNVYFTDFLPTNVHVFYLRKPKLFNIVTGQVPEINITKDFLDFAVKEFNLILNSPNYEKVLNQSVRNL